MKKNILLLSAVFAASITLVGCGPTQPEPTDPNLPTVFCPVGSTLLGISEYASKYQDKVTVGNATLIPPAFINTQFDIIVAPITAAVNVYSKAQNYKLDNTFVWGNFYILSNEKISSVADLEDKTIASFQKGNVPEIVLETVLKENEVNCTVNYLSNVEATATAFLGGTADIIVSAEPSVQQILSKKPGTHVLDLQEEYKKVTNNAALPQAGIFVSNEYISKVKDYDKYVNLLRESVKSVNSNPLKAAENAMQLTDNFQNLGAEKLAAAVPGCNFAIKSKEENKAAINAFLTNSNNILATTYTLPDEAFYL
jgi:NitT/TauT family transport system substrate-binding protein